MLREAIIGVSSYDNQVSVIKNISMLLYDINEMISGILFWRDLELMSAAFKGGEVRLLAITDECFLGCEGRRLLLGMGFWYDSYMKISAST